MRAVKSGDILMERLDEARSKNSSCKTETSSSTKKPHNYKNYVGSNAHKEIE